MKKNNFGRRSDRVIINDSFVILAMKEFYEKHGRYPGYMDWGVHNGLPTKRSLERNGIKMKEIRKVFGINPDMRTGVDRSEVASRINKREIRLNSPIKKRLVQMFGERNVHIESTFTDDHRNRVDFKVYFDGGCYLIDVFYPSTQHSYLGCVAQKKNKYKNALPLIDDSLKEILFVCLNKHIEIKKSEIGDKIRVIGESDMWKLLENERAYI